MKFLAHLFTFCDLANNTHFGIVLRLLTKVYIESRPHENCGYTSQGVLGVFVDQDQLFEGDLVLKLTNKY
ncbi:hypothetical protein TUM4438_29470 [Shewanella sairae]|uniref:Transposase n=1 Tax=Shewanella sairae TaxID=190310 RepID=A0ABQ4PKB6_9GAMM|nr:hypothetical protein TUM4438_29470 [Shewanella sairae]